MTEQQCQLLDEPLSKDDIALAVKSLKNNKCPGMDGIPIEVYKCFWGRLGELLLSVFQESIMDGKLHLLVTRGIISLLEKLIVIHSFKKTGDHIAFETLTIKYSLQS